MILVVGFAAAFYAFVDFTSSAIERDKITTAALAQVKEALIGFSASRTPTGLTPTARPGELPCPDIDNTGTDAGGCSAGAIGRVPWKSLGIPEPKDGAGETLWYAIAGPFRYWPSNNNPITSDTLGNLTVYLGSSATTLTSAAIAVIFAPGVALGAQNRSAATTALCTTTGTTIARNLCATNYLELTGGGNNAQTGGPFIQTQSSGTFNDRVLAITNVDLMPVVEQRVAHEMMSILQAYKAAVGVYPWADLADGNSNGSASLGYYNHPRFPCGAAEPTLWGSGGTLPLPLWLTNGCATVTGWAGVIYYAVAKNRLESGGINCTTCSGSSLIVDGVSGTDLVLITPGAYTGTPARSWPGSFGTITGYFDDAANADNSQFDNTFVTPTGTTYNRDRIFKLP